MTALSRFFFRTYRFLYKIQHGIMLRFTPPGRFVMAAMIAAAVFGVDTNRSMTFQLFTIIAGLLSISVAWGLVRDRFLKGRITVMRHLPVFATAGMPLSYRIVFKNSGSREMRGLSFFETFENPCPDFNLFDAAREPGGRKRNPVDRIFAYHRWIWLIQIRQTVLPSERYQEWAVPDLMPYGITESTVRITPCRRGRMNLKGCVVAAADPFGLFRSLVRIPASNAVTVLPRRYPVGKLNLPGQRKYQPGGVASASSVGESLEFAALRDYRPGDPPRRIHWKSYARSGRPVVREYQEEFFVRHALILDTFAPFPADERFEAAVSVASSFAGSVISRDSLLDMIFVGTASYCFTSGRGLGSTARMLEILASVSPCPDQSFDALSCMVLSRAGILSACICVLLSWDAQRQELIRRLKSLRLPVKVLLVQELPENPEPGPMTDLGPMKDTPFHFHTIPAKAPGPRLKNL